MSSINYVPRVTQLDALQLDDEIIKILKGQLLETSKYFKPGLLTPIVPELELILRSVVFKYSVLQNGHTFGQHMLSLGYDKNLLSKGKLYWLYGYTVILKYFKDRCFLSYTNNATAQRTLSAIERFQIVGDFLNLLRFLQTGKNPALIDFLLNLEMTSEKSIAGRYADYAWTRELLWHSFIELLGYAAPLLNTGFVKRLLKENPLNIFRRKPVYSTFSNLTPLLTRTTKCPECGEHPILPHHMGCDHIFCHYCLQANKLENPNYKCPRCNISGPSVLRYP